MNPLQCPATTLRTGGGAVERAGLENQYAFRCIVGSNPTLSAFKDAFAHARAFFDGIAFLAVTSGKRGKLGKTVPEKVFETQDVPLCLLLTRS